MQSYRAVDAALVRATVRSGQPPASPWPDANDPARAETARGWLVQAWERAEVAEAVGFASPALASRVADVLAGRDLPPAQLRRVITSVARYLVRMRGRATPFGAFAGVAPLRFGAACAAPLGRADQLRAKADARWLAEVIARLESCAEVRRRLPVQVNSLVAVRGDRLVVPWAPHASRAARGASAVVSVRRSRAVETVVELARSPMRGGDLLGKLSAELPQASTERLEKMLAELIACGLLISGLRPPATSRDGLAHLLARLDAIDAAGIGEVSALVEELRGIHAELALIGKAREEKPVRRRMRALSGVVEQPMMVDLRIDGSMTLPQAVADEAAGAADALARATPHPAGDPRLRDFHTRFVERYGVGALVRIDELIDPTHGLGFPPHYADDEDRTGLDPRLSHRDERLLALAQQAALDGAREVELSEGFLDQLTVHAPVRPRPAPHVELCAEVHASTVADLNHGAFRLAVRGVSRSGLALSGRFVDLLPAGDQQRMADQYGRLPTTVDGALAAQLSFPPRYPKLENVARAPRLLPTVLSLAEHREPADDDLGLDDLAVTTDGDRLYVVSVSRQCVVEPVVVNAAARRAWPPVARLLVDIARSGTAAVSPFAWGAASVLPFLPRVRYRRSVLCPARWRIDAPALPAPGAPREEWTRTVALLRDRLGLPAWVSVGDADRLLRLNLDEAMDVDLLRAHLDQATRSAESVTIAEAPTPADHGWSDGRPHEIVVPLAAARPSAPAPAIVTRVATAAAPLIGTEHGVLPGGQVLFAKLYGDPTHINAVLTGRLSRLLTELGHPTWWFIRYRHPRSHLRLRFHLHPEHYGPAVAALGAWAAELRRHGLTGDLDLSTHRPEIARYGPGEAMDAAHELFTADSAAAVAQIRALAAARDIYPRALTAASMINLAAAMTGGRSVGMRWLLDRRPSRTVGALPREAVRQAIHLADPADDYTALRSVAEGELIAEAWQNRHRAAARYAASLARTPDAPAPETVLVSLLHMHHIRAVGIDADGERITDRVARAVALAWSARSNTPRGGER
ncbi:lantibiotic dehydratase [Streptomyces sodiiphilus]|uniref:Lantibiotic dehydratase n=1 Tax=Streptomyces sodiiphilus TaxID=226217 RepID=A0ABN2PR75_9ACTN